MIGTFHAPIAGEHTDQLGTTRQHVVSQGAVPLTWPRAERDLPVTAGTDGCVQAVGVGSRGTFPAAGIGIGDTASPCQPFQLVVAGGGRLYCSAIDRITICRVLWGPCLAHNSIPDKPANLVLRQEGPNSLLLGYSGKYFPNQQIQFAVRSLRELHENGLETSALDAMSY